MLRNNAFGIVLLAAGGFWQLGCLESDNAWDYLIDPIYWLLSIANLICGWLAKLPTIARGPTAGRTAAMIALVFMWRPGLTTPCVRRAAWRTARRARMATC